MPDMPIDVGIINNVKGKHGKDFPLNRLPETPWTFKEQKSSNQLNFG